MFMPFATLVLGVPLYLMEVRRNRIRQNRQIAETIALQTQPESESSTHQDDSALDTEVKPSGPVFIPREIKIVSWLGMSFMVFALAFSLIYEKTREAWAFHAGKMVWAAFLCMPMALILFKPDWAITWINAIPVVHRKRESVAGSAWSDLNTSERVMILLLATGMMLGGLWMAWETICLEIGCLPILSCF